MVRLLEKLEIRFWIFCSIKFIWRPTFQFSVENVKAPSLVRNWTLLSELKTNESIVSSKENVQVVVLRLYVYSIICISIQMFTDLELAVKGVVGAELKLSNFNFFE